MTELSVRDDEADPVRVLVLGAGGMLGHAVLRYFASSPGYAASGSVRSPAPPSLLPAELRGRILTGIDALDESVLAQLLGDQRPHVVVNCIGLVKQLTEADDPLIAIPINSLLPHRLARLCESIGARFIHVSTDCVFAGTLGMYRESDMADATDLYGRSKHLGEVDYPHAITLRTSIIGHELGTAHGLLEWFLGQEGNVRGYRKAVFSGLPTVELARVIRDYVIPHRALRGVYHVASSPINKHDLLALIAAAYQKRIDIVPDDRVVIDRSLDGSRFRDATAFVAPEWPDMVTAMYLFR